MPEEQANNSSNCWRKSQRETVDHKIKIKRTCEQKRGIVSSSPPPNIILMIQYCTKKARFPLFFFIISKPNNLKSHRRLRQVHQLLFSVFYSMDLYSFVIHLTILLTESYFFLRFSQGSLPRDMLHFKFNVFSAFGIFMGTLFIIIS